MHKLDSGSHNDRFATSAIGLIHTPFNSATGTPIQAAASEDSQGVVEVFPEFITGLRDLEESQRIWLNYLLDRATEVQMVVRPYMDTVERGVYATRSLARPNHIGLSAIRLLGIEENSLLIVDVDMLDGTLLLDIKPYVPAFDCFEVTRTGWYQGKSVHRVVADDRFEKYTPDTHHA